MREMRRGIPNVYIVVMLIVWVLFPFEKLLLYYDQKNSQDGISLLGHAGPDAPE
jgi:hypothetical protein